MFIHSVDHGLMMHAQMSGSTAEVAAIHIHTHCLSPYLLRIPSLFAFWSVFLAAEHALVSLTACFGKTILALALFRTTSGTLIHIIIIHHAQKLRHSHAEGVYPSWLKFILA